MKGLYAIIFVVVTCLCTAASYTNYQAAPLIDIYQGTTPGTSVIVITWPDGVVERLVYKNKDVKNGSDGYLKWLQDRYDAYEERARH